MAEMIHNSTLWPTLPMSVIVVICCFYWLMVIVGMLDLDIFDIDFDATSDSPVGIGFVSLRFLNIGNVPLMLWVSIFSLSGWLISMFLDHPAPPEGFRAIATALGRNVGLALVATKLATQPLRGRFDPVEPHRAADLIGQQCVVTSTTASSQFGQALYQTEASPLILHVQAESGDIPRDSVVQIIDYIPETTTYVVRPVHSGEEV